MGSLEIASLDGSRACTRFSFVRIGRLVRFENAALHSLVILTAGLSLLLQSCLALPIPLEEDKVLVGSPVAESQLSFIRPGVTTREQVIKHLGQPFIIWEDARVFIYRWDMRQGILIWAIAGNRNIAGDAIDIPKHYLLLIAFDGNNIVTRCERTSRPTSRSAPDFLMDWLNGTDTSSRKDN
jgi:outer membrane protein assembly factor BamE (lipoprotein component of BamABCDE complex)